MHNNIFFESDHSPSEKVSTIFKNNYNLSCFLVLNINGNLVQIAGTAQQATTNGMAQTTVTSPTSQVVPQTLTTASPNQLAMANGNLVMVRNATDVR